MGGDDMTAQFYHLDHLNANKELGYDVSAVRTAVENPEEDIARSLMQSSVEDYKDEFPAPACRERPGW
jgi:hypothetical protein